MKGLIEVTATTDQLESIGKHYDEIVLFRESGRLKKTVGFIFKEEVTLYKDPLPRGCFIRSGLSGNKNQYLCEKSWSKDFREIYEQLKSKQPVQLDQEAYSSFLALTQ